MPELPEGVHVRRVGESIEKIAMERNAIVLLERADGVESILFQVGEGERFAIGADPEWDGMEWFYVLEGKLRLELVDVTLGPGDRLTTEHFSGEPLFVRAEADTTFLQVVSRPTFHAMSARTQELKELAVQVEAKDGYTRAHCRRIHEWSVQVGELLGLSRTRLFWLAYGAYLHDVGKVGIPDAILGKPGPLSDEERRVMQRHPEIGQRMLSGTYLEPAGIIVAQHHERLDGSGYPLGLGGDEITVEAQIVAAVDTFDAITSDRPYQKRRTDEEAVAILRKESGRLFDPKVVDALVKVIGKVQRTMDPKRMEA